LGEIPTLCRNGNLATQATKSDTATKVSRAGALQYHRKPSLGKQKE